jgi:hypothetical protein
LSLQLNFRLELVSYPEENFRKQKFHTLCDLLTSQSHLSDIELFHISSTLYMDEMTIAVPAGEPLTDLEKMFAMFDNETWIAIGFIFSFALITIQIFNLASTVLKKFIFGRDVQTPTFNLISIFFTGFQSKLPGRNFSRFLLMMFMIWCLIIRTCYQSMLFENLQSDMRHPRVKTFTDFNEMNFTLLLAPHEQDWINRLDGRQVWCNFSEV